MNKIVRFRAPSGDEMVILTSVDYDRLLASIKDAEDVAAYDRAKARLGEDEMIPSEVVDRLLAGENRVRVWREHRGLTAIALADRSDIGQGFLSQIETGKREGTVDTLRKLATALGVTIDDLVG